MKTLSGSCPFPEEFLDPLEGKEIPDPLYSERGDHRQDPPEDASTIQECTDFFNGELLKRRIDLAIGYLNYDRKCGMTIIYE